MEKEKPRIARLISIITQLQSKRPVTANEIAERHGISIRTVYRDIKVLELSGVPLIAEEGKGYTLVEGYRVPPVMFTEEETFALATATKLLEKHSEKALADHCQAALDKVKAMVRLAQQDKANLLESRMQIRNNTFEPQSSFLTQLQAALANYQVMRMEYLSSEQKQSIREIEPFAFYRTSSVWVMIAFCRLRQDFRAFRIDRIMSLQTSNTHFSPHEMTLEEYFKKERKKFLPTTDIPMTLRVSNFEANKNQVAMKKIQKEGFKVIGLSIRISNHGEAVKDIEQLWDRFLGGQILAKIPAKAEQNIYAIYMDYEGDYTQPYTYVVGAKVSSHDQVPEGMVGVTVGGGEFGEFMAKGSLSEGAIYQAWSGIWQADISRAYAADYEVYGEKALDPTNVEVPIYISLKA